MKRAVIAVVAVGFIATSAGCANNNPTPVSAKAADALAPFVTALRQAASHKSISAVQNRVSDLDGEVSALVQSNDLSNKRGQAIEDAAATLLTHFRRKNTPTAPPTSETPSATPSDTQTTSKPAPTVTITTSQPKPTDTGSAAPTETETSGNGNGNGNGNAEGNGFGNGFGHG